MERPYGEPTYSQVRKELAKTGVLREGLSLVTAVARWRAELARDCNDFFPGIDCGPITDTLALRVRLESEGFDQVRVGVVLRAYEARVGGQGLRVQKPA